MIPCGHVDGKKKFQKCGGVIIDRIDELIERLGSEDLAVRCDAIDALGKTGDARAIMPLLSLLSDENAGFRAAYALSKIGAPAVESLIGLVEDEGFLNRNGAVDALGEIGDARAVKSLLNLLGNDDKGLQCDAAAALVKIGEPAVEPLIELLKNEDCIVRIRAANTLGRIGDVRALEPLIIALWDTDELVSLCVSDALDTIDCDWTKKQCAQNHLHYLSEALMNGNIPVKFHVIDILERIGDQGATEILTKALKLEEKNVQLRAAEALERIKKCNST